MKIQYNFWGYRMRQSTIYVLIFFAGVSIGFGSAWIMIFVLVK